MAELRLIDANALPNYKCQVTATVGGQKGPAEMRFVFWQDIEKAPTVDAVPVVRCRECVHNEDEDVCPFVRVNRGKNWLEIIKPHPDGFCHMGAKMDGGADNG